MKTDFRYMTKTDEQELTRWAKRPEILPATKALLWAGLSLANFAKLLTERNDFTEYEVLTDSTGAVYIRLT